MQAGKLRLLCSWGNWWRDPGKARVAEAIAGLGKQSPLPFSAKPPGQQGPSLEFPLGLGEGNAPAQGWDHGECTVEKPPLWERQE
jgi:hypothetical protein